MEADDEEGRVILPVERNGQGVVGITESGGECNLLSFALRKDLKKPRGGSGRFVLAILSHDEIVTGVRDQVCNSLGGGSVESGFLTTQGVRLVEGAPVKEPLECVDITRWAKSFAVSF